MAQLILPPGKATGCLPRTTRLGEICPLYSERQTTIPQAEWPGLIAQQSPMRPFVWHVFDQDGIGSCATESTSQGIMVIRRFRGAESILLNPWFIYQTTSGGRDQGSTIDGNLQFVRKNGVAPESVWPRYRRGDDGYPIYINGQPVVINNWNARPSEEAKQAALGYRLDEFYDVNSVLEAGSALLTGFCVVFGWEGHSVLAVQLQDSNTLLYINSWAPSWGDNGFGPLSLNAVNWRYGAFAIRSTIRGGG